MERITLDFDFTDSELAQFIANSTPPTGIEIGKPKNIVKAGVDSGGFFTTIAIWFKHDSHEVLIGLLAAWLYDKFKQCNKKSCTINRSKIILSERSISRLIKKQLADNKRRESQYRRDKNRQLKKSS